MSGGSHKNAKIKQPALIREELKYINLKFNIIIQILIEPVTSVQTCHFSNVFICK